MRILQAATALVLALACAVGSARAQFTAAVIPPERAKATDTTARVDSVRKQQQKTMREQMSSMKEWVDSAALALASAPDSTGAATETASASGAVGGADTTAPVQRHGDSVTVVSSGEVANAPPESTATVRRGAPAPATASSLPLFALIGVGLLATGAALMRR